MSCIIKRASTFTPEYLAENGLTGIPSDWPINIVEGVTAPAPDGWELIEESVLQALKLNLQTQYDAWLASKMTAPPVQAPTEIKIVDDITTPRDPDGSPIYKYKVTQTGWSLSGRCVSWKAGKYNSLENKTDLGDDIGDASLKFYSAAGTQLSFQQAGYETETVEEFQLRLDQNCVKTIMDFEPFTDYDILGASLFVTNPNNSVGMLWATAAPHIPFNMGGSKPMLTGGLDLSFFGDKTKFVLDGRGVKRMTYNAVDHRSKIRCTLKHGLGATLGLQILFDTFVG